MTPEQIKSLIQSEIQRMGAAGRFQLASVPRHIHNGADAPKIPGTSVTSLLTVPSGPGDVLGNTLDTQSFSYLGKIGQTPVLALPLGVIYGYGAGVHSAFNGGDAPDGTMLLFTNGDAASYLVIKSSGSSSGWFGINLTTVG